MLTIRLRRTGGKRNPHFRVVVADRRTSRDGPFLEILGHYHPRRDPAEFTIDREATDSWVEKGAQLSDTVRTLIRQLDAGKVREPKPTGRPVAAPEATEEGADGTDEGNAEEEAVAATPEEAETEEAEDEDEDAKAGSEEEE